MNLVLSIILTSCLFVVFKYFKILKVSLIQAISVNYIVCLVVGATFTYFTAPLDHIAPSFWAGFAAGMLFLPVFWVTGFVTQQLGLTVAGIASKTSMIIPAFAMLLIDPMLRSHFSTWKYIAILLSLVAIILSNLNPSKGNPSFNYRLLIFPLLVFFGGGMVDLTINLAAYYTEAAYSAWIPVGTFCAAALSGTVVLLFKRFKNDEKLTMRSIWGGIALGIPNFFSLYFLVKTLDQYHNDGATVYPLINTGTILLNTLLSIIVFKDHVNKYIIAGVVCAIVAILLMNV